MSDLDSFDRHTLGLIKTLEKREEICDVKLSQSKPADKSDLLSWEQHNSCTLPDDLKGFYTTMNGLSLTWSVKLDDTLVPVGCLYINSLHKLMKLSLDLSNTHDYRSVLLCLQQEQELSSNTKSQSKPSIDSRSRMFELDSCDRFSKVCLVYNNTNTGVIATETAGIWFLDRALQWHLLADSFLIYYRMALAHLGLPEWQYTFTDIGVSPQAKQWFNIYCPIRFGMDISISDGKTGEADGMTAVKLDIDKVFKGKADKKKSVVITQVNRKKPTTLTTSAKPGSGKSVNATTLSQSVRTGSGQK